MDLDYKFRCEKPCHRVYSIVIVIVSTIITLTHMIQIIKIRFGQKGSLLDDSAHQCNQPNLNHSRLNWTGRLDDQ